MRHAKHFSSADASKPKHAGRSFSAAPVASVRAPVLLGSQSGRTLPPCFPVSHQRIYECEAVLHGSRRSSRARGSGQWAGGWEQALAAIKAHGRGASRARAAGAWRRRSIRAAMPPPVPKLRGPAAHLCWLVDVAVEGGLLDAGNHGCLWLARREAGGGGGGGGSPAAGVPRGEGAIPAAQYTSPVLSEAAAAGRRARRRRGCWAAARCRADPVVWPAQFDVESTRARKDRRTCAGEMLATHATRVQPGGAKAASSGPGIKLATTHETLQHIEQAQLISAHSARTHACPRLNTQPLDVPARLDTPGMLGAYGPIKLAPPAPPASPTGPRAATSGAPGGLAPENVVHGKPAAEKVCQVGRSGAPKRGGLCARCSGLAGACAAACAVRFVVLDAPRGARARGDLATQPLLLAPPACRCVGGSCRRWASRATTW